MADPAAFENNLETTPTEFFALVQVPQHILRSAFYGRQTAHFANLFRESFNHIGVVPKELGAPINANGCARSLDDVTPLCSLQCLLDFFDREATPSVEVNGFAELIVVSTIRQRTKL